MASHLVLALLGTAALLVVWGLGAGLTYGLAIHDVSGQVGRLIGAALIQWPAAALLAGVVAVLFGRWPRATTGAWALLAAFAALGQFGPLLRLAQPVMDVSPFTHVPKMPGGALALTPVISLALIAAALVAAGLFTFRRRDIG
jgi:ABC-2 type transport system permease protein